MKKNKTILSLLVLKSCRSINTIKIHPNKQIVLIISCFKSIVSIFLGLVITLTHAYSAQLGSLGYTLLNGVQNPIYNEVLVSSFYKSKRSVADIRGAYELASFSVTYSNGSTFSSSNTSAKGIMSITSTSFFQGVTISGTDVIAAGTYTQTSNTLTFNNMGVSFPSSATYSWDGLYLTTVLKTSSFEETDVWKRTEDFSDSNGATEDGITQCQQNPISCGISVDSNTDGSTEEGIAQCQADPSSCGISTGVTSNTSAAENTGTLSADLNIYIPSINYETILGEINIYANFEYAGSNNEGKHLWLLKDFGENQ